LISITICKTESGSSQGQVADCCEYGNEPLGSIQKNAEFDYLRKVRSIRKDSAPWSELVRNILSITRRLIAESQLQPNVTTTQSYNNHSTAYPSPEAMICTRSQQQSAVRCSQPKNKCRSAQAAHWPAL